jgi:hypothetical protein
MLLGHLTITQCSVLQAISDMVKAQVQPLLNNYAMGVINRFELQNMSLGTKAPRFEGELGVNWRIASLP